MGNVYKAWIRGCATTHFCHWNARMLLGLFLGFLDFLVNFFFFSKQNVGKIEIVRHFRHVVGKCDVLFITLFSRRSQSFWNTPLYISIVRVNFDFKLSQLLWAHFGVRMHHMQQEVELLGSGMWDLMFYLNVTNANLYSFKLLLFRSCHFRIVQVVSFFDIFVVFLRIRLIHCFSQLSHASTSLMLFAFWTFASKIIFGCPI